MNIIAEGRLPVHFHSHPDLAKWQPVLDQLHNEANGPSLSVIASYKKLAMKRSLLMNVFMCLLQYTGLVLGTLIPVPLPLSFAVGAASAFIFMYGYRVLPGIGLGTCLAYYYSGSAFSLAVESAVIYAFQAWALYFFSCYFLKPTLLFLDAFSFLLFLGWSALLTAAASGLLVYAYQPHFFHEANALLVLLEWWLAALNGIYIFACAMITWESYFPAFTSIKQLQPAKTIAFYTPFIFIILALLFFNSLLAMLWLDVLALTMIFFMNRVYGWCGMIAGLFLMGFILNLGTLFHTQTAIGLSLCLLLNTIIIFFIHLCYKD